MSVSDEIATLIATLSLLRGRPVNEENTEFVFATINQTITHSATYNPPPEDPHRVTF